MARNSFSSPTLRRDETQLGWIYFVFQLLLLPSILTSLNALLPAPFSKAEVNFTYFLLNFMAMIWIFHRFLGASFRVMTGHPIVFCQAIVLGLFSYWVTSVATTWALHQLDPGFVNRNDASIAAMTRGSYYLMAVGTALLVPPVEECFYRGLMFRNLYKTSPIAAYLVSMAVFSLVHILGFIGSASPLSLLLSFVQYLPAGLWLAWTYTKADTIFAPIVMHGLINFYTLNQLR